MLYFEVKAVTINGFIFYNTSADKIIHEVYITCNT